MPKRSLVRTSPSSKLLARLTDNPQLPNLVPKLPTSVLSRLLGTIGVEDSGAIIALTTTTQLQHLFDDVLWRSLEAGARERLDPEAFILWLGVLNQQGAVFVAERLNGLGLQFCVAQFAQVIEVHNKEVALLDGVVDISDDFGDYLVRSKYEEEWDIIRFAIAALSEDYPETLSDMLAQCCVVSDGFRVPRPAVSVTHDEAHDRNLRRTAEGYVTRDNAREFLGLQKANALNEIFEQTAYDPQTRGYFATMQGADPEADDEIEADVDETADFEQGIAELSEALTDLSNALAAADILPESRTQLLAGPQADADAPRSTLKAALDQLEAEQPLAFAARLAELVYLANVLMAAAVDGDDDLGEVDAAHTVLAIANLGTEYAIENRLATLDELIASEPGLIRLFAAGWHIVQRVPQQVARGLVAVLKLPEVRERLAVRAWILSEVELALADFVNRVDLGEFDTVADTLAMVSLVVEAQACAELGALISELPMVTASVELVGPNDKVELHTRQFDGLQDLGYVGQFLAALPEQIKI